MYGSAADTLLAKVDGWPINIGNQRQVIDETIAAARLQHSFAVFTLNLDHLVKLRRDPAFRAAYQKARFITADGAPVAYLARLQGRVEKTTGADLVEPLADAAAAAGIPIYLFGARPEVLGKAGRWLARRTDFTLDICGSEAPAQDFDPTSPAADAALDRIAASGARLCLVALGAPKQELFAARAVERGIKVGFVCVGAALDFLAGAQTRAPKSWQDLGLEWTWRLMTNPRRMAGRYTRCCLALGQIVMRTMRPSSPTLHGSVLGNRDGA